MSKNFGVSSFESSEFETSEFEDMLPAPQGLVLENSLKVPNSALLDSQSSSKRKFSKTNLKKLTPDSS